MVSKIKEFIIFILFPLNFFANEAAFQNGVDFYKKGDFENALKEWQSLEKNFNDWRVFYNIGNAYAKLNKIGFAMVYYERALKLSQDKRIEDNINFLKIKIKDKIEEEQKTPLRRTLERVYRSLNFKIVLYLFTISFFLINLILLIYLLFPSKFPKYLLIIFSFLVGFLFISGMFLYHFWYVEKKVHFGIIIQETVPVKSAPQEDATELFIIHEGLKVRLYEEVEGWLRIALPNGMSGFVLKESLEKV